MEPWDLIWDLHIDRPAVVAKVKNAFAAMLRQRHHNEAGSPRGYLEALLTILEYCGDFHCQSRILSMILYSQGVADYKDWLAPTWFRDMPNTLDSFLQLKMDDSEAAHCDFLHTYNKELDMQFIFSVRCCLVRWNDEYQLHARNGVVWLHLNCGSKTVSLTGVESTPPEVDRTWFVLKFFEIKKVEVDVLVSPRRGTLQGITILTTKGKLYVTPDPIIEDWSMFVDFIKFISKVRVEFVDLTDCNGNTAVEPSRNYYGQYPKFNENQNRNILMMQHLAPNTIVQVSSSQDDARKTLAHTPGDVPARLPHTPGDVPACLPHNPGEVPANLPHNPGEVPSNLPHNPGEVPANLPHNPGQVPANLPHNPGEVLSCLAHNQGEASMQICSDSDTNDIEICRHVKHDSTNESCNDSDTADDRSDKISILGDEYSQKTCEKEPKADINPVAETHSEPCISDKAAAGSNRFIPHDSCPDEKAAIIVQSELQHCDVGEEPKTDEDSIAAADKDLHVSKIINRTSKARKVARRKSAAPRLVRRALKPRGDDQTVRSDDDTSFVGTPRRETRAFTQSLKEVMPEYSLEFKTPSELPIKVQNRKRTNKKRKSDDSMLNSDVESSPPNATPLGRSPSPLAEETSCESHPPKSMKLSSGEDGGIVSVEEEAPNVPHPQSMPTLMTPIATPVREFTDSFIDDLSKTQEKLNEAQPTCIPPGPPPAVPLHVNTSFKMSVCQDYNSRYPIKPRNLEEDVTDVKSENGEAWESGMMDSSSDSYLVETAGSAVLLPDGGCPANPIRPEACPDNLKQFSDLCSRVVDETC